MIEDKEKITLSEFKAWLAGLILGKKGALPDLEDWKQIKVMLDKVEEEKEIVTVPSSPIPYPVDPTYPWQLETQRYGPIQTEKYYWSDNTGTPLLGGQVTISDTDATMKDLMKIVDGWYKE